MEENKNTTAVSLENLETFKAEMDAKVDEKVKAAATAGVTFATTDQIKALFTDAPADEGEENT